MSLGAAMISESVFTTTLAIVLLIEPAATTSEKLIFVVEPSVGTILLNPTLNVTFNCQVYSIEHSYEPMWTLYYPSTDQYLSTHNDDDRELIEAHGIHYYSKGTVSNITIPGTVENNTQLWCTTLHVGVTEFSNLTEIIIAGTPLPPNPNLKVLSSSQFEVQWDVPYSNENYPIQHYNIQIVNTSSGQELFDSVIENRYVYNTENGNTETQCDLLIFSITAVNELGQSVPGNVSGGFPIAPRLSPSEVNVAVMFYGNGTPIAKVTFEAPFICDYQTLNLMITIEDVTDLPALIHLPVSTGCSRKIAESFDTGLLANHAYTVNITTSDSATVEGVSIAAVNFSTTLHSALPSTQGLQLRDITILFGGVFAVLLVAIITIIIVTAIACIRKRKLGKAPGSTMDLMLNRSRNSGRMSARGSQYDTPYKSSTSLYETIDGYQKCTPAHLRATTQSPWKQQQYLWKPQQCNFESKKSGDSIETDTLYQEMHSASVCPCEQPGSVNGHNGKHAMKPQYLAAPHTDHDHPLKLHACRVELHADPTAGHGSDAFCVNDNSANTPFSHSESFGDHLSTVAVVNESVGSINRNGEGDQSEYTYMSKEGTLAGQQSKLTLCTNGCVKTDNQD